MKTFDQDRSLKFMRVLLLIKTDRRKARIKDFADKNEYLSFKRWESKNSWRTKKDLSGVIAQIEEDRGIQELDQEETGSPLPRREQRENQQEQAPKKEADVVLSKKQFIDFSQVFQGWEKMPHGKQLILEAGYRSALRCGESSHHAQTWKVISKAVLPNLFVEKKEGHVSTSDYEQVWEGLIKGKPDDYD